MGTINLLYRHEYPINENIKIYIPTVGEVLDNEDDYYSMITTFTAMPIDLMLELDDMGIDYTKITDYELFLLLFPGFKQGNTSLIFSGLNLDNFSLDFNKESKMPILIDHESGVVIDKGIYWQVAATLRKINHLKKNNRKPANDEAKKYMLERARIKRNRHKKTSSVSNIEGLIVALVNNCNFKYNFNETLGLTIYQFNESLQQLIKKDSYDNLMHGVYSGTVDAKKLNKDELNWLVHEQV